MKCLLKWMFGIAMLLQLNTGYAQDKACGINSEEMKAAGTIDKMVIAFHNKDIRGIMNCYEPGATIVFNPQVPTRGSKNIIAAYNELLLLNPHFEFSGHEVFVTGTIATHITPWTMTGKTPDGKEVTQSGLSVSLLRKQKNGEWLIFFDDPHGQFLLTR